MYACHSLAITLSVRVLDAFTIRYLIHEFSFLSEKNERMEMKKTNHFSDDQAQQCNERLAGYGQSIVFINTFLLCLLIISMSWILEFTLSHIEIGPDSIYSIKVLLCPAYAACNFILEYGAAFLFRLNSYIMRFLSHEPLTFSRSRSFSNIFPLYCLRKCWNLQLERCQKSYIEMSQQSFPMHLQFEIS